MVRTTSKPPDNRVLLADYLRSLTAGEARSVLDLLRPLAYAAGNGLPRGIWQALVKALSDPSRTPADIDWLLAHNPGVVGETAEDGRSVYALTSRDAAAFIYQIDHRPAAETHGIICRALIDSTIRFEGALGTDWRAADPYTRRHIVEHAAEANTMDCLINDPLFLATGDPLRVTKAMQTRAGSDSTLRVYNRCRQYWREECAEENVSYLELVALQSGEAALGAALAALPLKRRWLPCWAHNTCEGAHYVLGGHFRKGFFDMPEGGGLFKGAHGVDVAEVDGRAIAATCGYDYKIRMWDLENGVPVGEPFMFSGLGWAQPMCVAMALRDEKTFVIALTAVGDVFTWEWVGGPQELGRLAHASSIHPTEQMAFYTNKEHSLLGVCGTFLEVLHWDASGCSCSRLNDVVKPTAAAFGVLTGGERVLAVGDSEEMMVLRLDGTVLWRHNTLERNDDLCTRVFSNRSPYEPVTSVATTASPPDSVAIFGGEDGHIWVRRLQTGELVGNFIQAHRGSVTCLTVAEVDTSPILVSGGNDRLLKLWNLPDMTPFCRALRGHNGPINALKVAPVEGSRRIISASADRTIRVWDFPTTLGPQVPLPRDPALGVVVGEINDEEVAVVLTERGTMELWSSEDGAFVDSVSLALPSRDRLPLGNRIAVGSLSGERRIAVAPTLHDVFVCDTETGRIDVAYHEESSGGHNNWCVCVGTVLGRLARVAYKEYNDEGAAEVYDLESGKLISVAVEARGPLASLRLGEIGGEPVILSRAHQGLFAARLSDGSIVGSHFRMDDGIDFAPFPYPADVGELCNKPTVVMGLVGRTYIVVVPLFSDDRRISIDVGSRVAGLAIGSSGVVVATEKGLLKVDVTIDSLTAL